MTRTNQPPAGPPPPRIALQSSSCRRRCLSSDSSSPGAEEEEKKKKKKVKMTWSFQGETVEVEAEEGRSLMQVAHDNDIELEGACGGELACSTCHVTFDKSVYDQLPEKQEEEEDMLDLAWGLTDTSRLGCQIKVSPVLEGAVITIPEEMNNMMMDTPPPNLDANKTTTNTKP